MKPTELRIGNIVEVNHYEYGDMLASVTSINDVGDLCLHLLDERFTKEEYECTMNEVTPIPITEELLKKNGFEIDQNITEYELLSCYERRITAYEVKYGWNFHIDDEEYCTCFSNTLKYIHDLQNAYQLVTKEELTLQL